jgi:hypothetical protein
MPLFRTSLLATLLASAAALAQPALAETAATDAPVPAHQGQAFAVSQGAKARIVEPDGRVLVVSGMSDLVAPSSIVETRVKSAIAQLIRTEAVAKAAKAAPAPVLSRLQEP